MTCRLPQTPRTPTTGAAHYFDEVFTDKGRPKKPAHLRRSSTARSIGHRSDWENDEDDTVTPIARTNSVGYLNAEDMEKRAAIDQHVAHYVSDQLKRLQTSDSERVDKTELATSFDGASDEQLPRSNGNGGGDYFNA